MYYYYLTDFDFPGRHWFTYLLLPNNVLSLVIDKYNFTKALQFLFWICSGTFELLVDRYHNDGTGEFSRSIRNLRLENVPTSIYCNYIQHVDSSVGVSNQFRVDSHPLFLGSDHHHGQFSAGKLLSDIQWPHENTQRQGTSYIIRL